MVGRRNRVPAAGFTLIEMLLAIGIMSLILGMLASSFNVVSHGKVQAESRLDSNQAGRAIMWQMSQEIRSAVAVIPGTISYSAQPNMLLIGQGHQQGGHALDGLTIATRGAGHHHSVFGDSAEDLVTYSSSPNSNHRGWSLLIRAQQSGLIPPSSAASDPVVLADNVVGLHIRYYNGQIWNESWNSQQAGDQLPLPIAVSIDLQMETANGNPMNFSTKVAVPMAFPAQQR
jgi:prepilin-type N-terminal cleavage/methylation domain-containing protein